MKKVLYLLAASLVFAACENETQDTDTAASNGDTSALHAEGEKYAVDVANSAIYWLGKKPGKDHNGIVRLRDGEVIVNGDQVVGGRFTIDFTTIDNIDLKEKGDMKGHNKLTTHLKSDDFFGVEKYPTGTFVVTNITQKNGPGGANAEVTGNLTIKGKTNRETFPAKINVSDNKVTAEASFKVDRSKYDVRYGSKTFFPDKAVNDLIDDEIEIDLKLVANK